MKYLMHKFSVLLTVCVSLCLTACAQYGEQQHFARLNYGFGYYLGYGVRPVKGENRYVINYLGSLSTGRNWLDFYTLVGALETGERQGFACMHVLWKGGNNPVHGLDGAATAWRTVEYRHDDCASDPMSKQYRIASDLPRVVQGGVRTVLIEEEQKWD